MESRSAQQIWEAALGELQIQVNKPNYRTWLVKTAGLSYQDNQFIIGVPNTFVAEYLSKNQHSLIKKVLAGLTHHDVQVQFQVDGRQPNSSSSYDSRAKTTPVQQSRLPLFNPKYTFNSFVVGSCNQLAYTAALGLAQNPGRSPNPLYIYGGSGLGKTHLLHAIGHTALANNLRVLYVSAEQYTNDMVNAIRERQTDDFRNKYRDVDMLLMDDIQFFSGKKQTGENFFHTFNELHSANHQIAMTCDRPPQSLPLLPDRLRSRFEWGLVTDIQVPDFETRLAILQDKATEKGLNVPPDTLEFIALQIQQNIRALEGSLNRVVAYAKLLRAMVTPKLAAQALRDIAGNESKTAPTTPTLIIEAVVNHFQLTPQDLRGRKRDEATALARQVAMYLIRQETDCSLAEIGRELGGRSPATVSYAYQKIADDINSSSTLRRKILDIQQEICPAPKPKDCYCPK
ncbi:MAG: chromosomal replication initiator protein DnaA [Chloroflexi bacterium]|nr:chromosomal replication initiator protein DnaA [Chloroflexota bacterium]